MEAELGRVSVAWSPAGNPHAATRTALTLSTKPTLRLRLGLGGWLASCGCSWGWAFLGRGPVGQVVQGPDRPPAIPWCGTGPALSRLALWWGLWGGGLEWLGAFTWPFVQEEAGVSRLRPGPPAGGREAQRPVGGRNPRSLPSRLSQEAGVGGERLVPPVFSALVAMATDGGLAGERRGRALYEAEAARSL